MKLFIAAQRRAALQDFFVLRTLFAIPSLLSFAKK
jgi:hypothetical protein